jgi:type I restriction-modification system DNA methylase subunit
MKMSISTREQLKDLIHSIHDFIRNSGAGYGMKAMKIFNLFYGLKLIEDQFDKLKLPTFCKFSELVKEVNKKNIKDGEIIKVIQNILAELYKDKNLKTFVWYPIPIDIHQDTYVHIIKQVDKIPLNLKEISDELYDVDLKGKVYEYFIGRDKSAISELGAYYTDRHIINFIMDLVKPQLTKDGKIKTMIDPFGGSGGFTLTYIKYLYDNNDKINWKTDLKNIYHYDMELDVIKLAGLEMFGITGEFPVITENGITGNLKRTNTFKDPFMKDGKRINFDYIFSNPPYGGDNNNKDAEEEKRQKVIDYLKKDIDELKKNEVKNMAIIEKREDQLDDYKDASKKWKEEKDSKKVCYETCSKERIQAWVNDFNKGLKKEEKINPNDKEACSLILFMDLLAEDGVCIGVLKEGVFFDGKYSKIRGYLLENFDITHVISVPNDAFENTTTKTSIIIFKKKDKTTKIIFSELVVETEEYDVFEEIDYEI